MKRNELIELLEALFWVLILVDGAIIVILWTTGELW